MSATTGSSPTRPSVHAHPSKPPWQRPVLERLGSWRALTMQISSSEPRTPQEVPVGPGNAFLVPDPRNPVRLG